MSINIHCGVLTPSKSVTNEIEQMEEEAKDVKSLLDKEPMVKIPRRVFDKLLERYGMAATFESLYRKYENMAWWNQNKINDLTKQISELKSKVGQLTRFIEAKGLVEAFKEFIKPK